MAASAVFLAATVPIVGCAGSGSALKTMQTADASRLGALRPPRTPPPELASTRLTGSTSVPLIRLRHLMYVKVNVNGRGPYRFVIDTGSAALLRVSPALARGLSLPQVGVVQEGDPSGKNPRQVPVVRVASVAIGRALFSGIEASVGSELGEIRPDGIIGLGLFARLTAAIDYRGRTLRLSHAALPVRGRHVVGFTREQGVPQIKIRAADLELSVDIDTGGPAVLTVPASTRLPFQRKPRVIGTGRTATSEFTIRAAPLKGDLSVAGWTKRAPMIHIVDVFPLASLGSGFLRQYVVTFDTPNRRLALTR
jgi:hypothetical protein